MSTKREMASKASVRERMLAEAWETIESGRLAALTMAGIAEAAGVSRQTAYVQFGSRAGLLVQMVRERDEADPRAEEVERAIAIPDPAQAPAALARALGNWWRELHPVAEALYAASVTDEAAKAAWDDRMGHLRAYCERAVGRLTDAGILAPGWKPKPAADWLAAQLNPVAWLLLIEGAGWSQRAYEDRMAGVVTEVLVGQPSTRGRR